jgi:succinate dehydrogenase / fumarate reductase iron-sulfur subunit
VGLAAAERVLATTSESAQRSRILALLDDEHGLWRCHSAWECTEVCPYQVNPAEAIMRLKRLVAAEKFKRLFHR